MNVAQEMQDPACLTGCEIKRTFIVFLSMYGVFQLSFFNSLKDSLHHSLLY